MRLVNTEEVSPVVKRLTVEIDQDQVEKALAKQYKRLGKQAKLKGFRPGKAPRSVLERHYGPQINQEVAGELIEASATEAIEQSGLSPVVTPQVEPSALDPEAAYQYVMVVEIAPEVDIDDYFGLALTRKEREITDELVDSKLEDVRQMHATLETAPDDRAAAEGDTVLVDMTAGQDGQPLEGGQLNGFDLRLGTGRFNEDVEKAVVGLKKDEVANVEAEFPADFFIDALAGQKADLEITLREVKQTVLPELDDDFAASLGDSFKSLDELKSRIREEMTTAAARDAEREVNDQLMDQLIEKTEFEVPEGLVRQELNRLLEQVERSMSMRGMNLQAAGIDPGKLEDDLKPQALRRCQENLILEAIAAKEGLVVEEQDLQQGFEELGQSVGQTAEEVRKLHEENNLIESFETGLLRRKMLERLIEEAQVTVEKVTEEEAKED